LNWRTYSTPHLLSYLCIDYWFQNLLAGKYFVPYQKISIICKYLLLAYGYFQPTYETNRSVPTIVLGSKASRFVLINFTVIMNDLQFVWYLRSLCCFLSKPIHTFCEAVYYYEVVVDLAVLNKWCIFWLRVCHVM